MNNKSAIYVCMNCFATANEETFKKEVNGEEVLVCYSCNESMSPENRTSLAICPACENLFDQNLQTYFEDGEVGHPDTEEFMCCPACGTILVYKGAELKQW